MRKYIKLILNVIRGVLTAKLKQILPCIYINRYLRINNFENTIEIGIIYATILGSRVTVFSLSISNVYIRISRAK